MVALIFIAGLIRHESFFDILGFALVLTIASIPVAQPAVLSVTLDSWCNGNGKEEGHSK